MSSAPARRVIRLSTPSRISRPIIDSTQGSVAKAQNSEMPQWSTGELFSQRIGKGLGAGDKSADAVKGGVDSQRNAQQDIGQPDIVAVKPIKYTAFLMVFPVADRHFVSFLPQKKNGPEQNIIRLKIA